MSANPHAGRASEGPLEMHDNLKPPTESGQIGIPPAPAVMRILSRFDRQKIDAFIEVAIELIDARDGDPDFEVDDEDFGADDVGENRTTVEVVDQRKHARHALVYAHSDDDAEDDDPAGGNVEDEPHDSEEDCCMAGDDHIVAGGGQGARYQGAAGSDDDAEVETWSHPDDHPAELFIGRPPANANNPTEAA